MTYSLTQIRSSLIEFFFFLFSSLVPLLSAPSPSNYSYHIGIHIMGNTEIQTCNSRCRKGIFASVSFLLATITLILFLSNRLTLWHCRSLLILLQRWLTRTNLQITSLLLLFQQLVCWYSLAVLLALHWLDYKYNDPVDQSKLKSFEKVLKADKIDIKELKELAWTGIPSQYRAETWKILLVCDEILAD